MNHSNQARKMRRDKAFFKVDLRPRMNLWLCLLCMSIPVFVVTYMTTVCMGGCGAPNHSKGPFITYFPYRHWRNNEVKTILLWTSNFGDPWWGQEGQDTFGPCPNKCRMTINKDELDKADALLFHSRALWNYFIGYTMPPYHSPHQVWILNNGEPPPHVFLNMKRYNNIFNWTFWYRSEADIHTVTGKMVRIDNESISWQTESNPVLKSMDGGQASKYYDKLDMLTKSRESNYYRSKGKFLVWTASNCKDQGRRQRLVKELQNYIHFDTFGSCGDKKLPCHDAKCDKYLSPYRFALAFENSLCRDYVTEKFWLALDRGQIPIVYGGTNYSKVAPRNSFIDVRDFDDMKTLAGYIKQINSNEKKFNGYFWWKKHYKIIATPEPWCDLCAALHDKTKRAQVYSDLNGWYRNDTCPQFSITDAVSRFIEGMLLKYNTIK